MRRRAPDECDPAHHRIATRRSSGAPCCTAESPSADSAIGNRYSGYTSPRPWSPACRSGACHRRAWPAESTVQHTPTRHPSDRSGISGDHDCISLGSQASTSDGSWANQITSFESKRFSRFKKFRNGHLARRRAARFSILVVEGRHQEAGLVATDLFRRTKVWLVDMGLESSLPERAMIATRLFTPEQFSVDAGAHVPFDPAMLEN